MKVVKLLLNGDKIENVKKHTDEFYQILGAKNLIINRWVGVSSKKIIECKRLSSQQFYRTHFSDRELVNIYLVHHIEYGPSVDKSVHDTHSFDSYHWAQSVPQKAMHANEAVVENLTEIEDIFKSRYAIE